MSLTRTALSRFRGDTSTLSIPLVDPDTGATGDPSGCTLIFTLKRRSWDTDANALVQKTSAAGGITVANPSVVTLLPADFAVLTPNVSYEFDIQAQNNSTGALKTFARGSITFTDDVTKNATITIPTVTTQPSFVQNLIPFLASVVGPTGGGLTKLDGQVTVGASVPLLVAISLADDFQGWKLRTKGVGETEDGVSFVKPDDSTTLMWVRIF